MTSTSLFRLAAASLALASAAACHSSRPAVAARPDRAVRPACGTRSAVALLRAPSSRRTPRLATGALVVRVAAADSGGRRPGGPIRVRPVASRGATPVERRLAVESAGLARSGPLPVGRYVVEAGGRGYESRRLTVAVRPGATDTVRFRLATACGAGAD